MSKEEPILKYSMDGYNKLVKEFQQESDRSVIIVAVSYIENYLEYCLKKRFVKHTVVNSLFDGYAPLSTLSAKIDIGFSIGLLNEEIHSELHKLRKIRNLSAHDDSIVNFQNYKVKDLCNNLISAKGIRTSSKNHFKVNDSRAQFLLSISWCTIHLETQRKRIDPIPILKLKFEIVDDE
jgi:DNA-binding MltR family transcriptional regulator